MNPDVSLAPEIAQLMEPLPSRVAPVSTTIGELARALRNITASPDRWWSLVRFDAGQPVRVALPTSSPAGGAYEAWLSILPPGAGDDLDCRCDVVTVVAGELTEPGCPKPLVPGRVRVHGAPGPHRAVNTGDGYTVSLHLRGRPGQ
ncbi:MAG TPA: hypothetical protein VGD68_14350 [Streptosporangiaceae bacterium]